MEIYFNLNFDNASSQKAATVIYSILRHIPEALKPRFHILHFDISLFNQLRLKLLVRKLNRKADIRFFRIDKENFHFPVEANSPVTPEAYLRIIAPDFLPDDAGRMLYLDIDTLVVADLAQLFSLDFEGRIIAACMGGAEAERKKMLGMAENAPYFNSGVMLVNVPLWRQTDIGPQTLSFIKEWGAPLPRWDQDALNHVLRGKWLRLPGIYNTRFCGQLALPDDLYAHVRNSLAGGGGDDLLEQIFRARIIHYTGWGRWKPWFSDSLASNAIFYQKIYDSLPYFFGKTQCWK